MMKKMILIMVIMGFLSFGQEAVAGQKDKVQILKIREKADLTIAPEVPAPITRKEPAVVEVHLQSSRKMIEIKPGIQYEYWTFNEHVPGPFIRVRLGDVIEVHHTSTDATGMPHNIDLHSVTGPGGGAPVTTVVQGEERVSWFKMLHPGLFVYHCAAPPVMDHIANGMFGLILVEPEKGLPKVDREFYVMQHELYVQPDPALEVKKEEGHQHGKEGEKKEDDFWGEELGKETQPTQLQFSHQMGLDEHPIFVLFNEKYNALVNEGKLKAKTGEKVRIYFGNGGPNLISSFHVIGEIFDNVYREADLVSPPAHSVQTTLVPSGGATVVDFSLEVPGTYTLVDHAIFRVEKGAVGFLEVEGDPRHDIYVSDQEATKCKGCLVHP